MRNIYFLIIAAGLFAGACNKKAGESLERDMADFEKKWAGLQNDADIWSRELAIELDACSENNQHAIAFVKANERILPEEKLRCRRFLDSCISDQKLFEQMRKEWKDTDSLWQLDSGEWTRWKNDWNKGRLKIEIARKDLLGWNNKHRDYSERLAGWKSYFNVVRRIYHHHRRNMKSSCGFTGNKP